MHGGARPKGLPFSLSCSIFVAVSFFELFEYPGKAGDSDDVVVENCGKGCRTGSYVKVEAVVSFLASGVAAFWGAPHQVQISANVSREAGNRGDGGR